MSGSYHHGNLREALLDAVERLLEQGGLESLSLRACAREAGVSPAAPAHHFGDKRGLLTEFVLIGFQQLTARMQEELERCDGSPRERVKAVGRGYLLFAIENRTRFSVMFRPELIDREDERFGESLGFGLLLDALAALDEELGRSGRGRLDRAMFCWSTVHGFACLWTEGARTSQVTMGGPVKNARPHIEAVLESAVAGLVADADSSSKSKRTQRPSSKGVK